MAQTCTKYDYTEKVKHISTQQDALPRQQLVQRSAEIIPDHLSKSPSITLHTL